MQTQGYFRVKYQHQKENLYGAEMYSEPCQTSKM